MIRSVADLRRGTAFSFPRSRLHFTTGVSGCAVALSICHFAAFVIALFRCSIPPLSLEMINPCFCVDLYDHIVRAMLLCLLLRAEVRRWIYIGRAEA